MKPPPNQWLKYTHLPETNPSLDIWGPEPTSMPCQAFWNFLRRHWHHDCQGRRSPTAPTAEGGGWRVRGALRTIPFSKWLVTPIYKPFRPLGMGITLLRGLLSMVVNHLLTGMILQVGEQRQGWIGLIINPTLSIQSSSENGGGT